MNLELINSFVIPAIVPRTQIAIYAYVSEDNDAAGIVTPTYAAAIYTTAQIELINNQELIHNAAITATEIYKRFYIQSSSLTGLNRSLQTAGDYIKIISSGLQYKIIEVRENFEVGWVYVLGIESTSRNEG